MREKTEKTFDWTIERASVDLAWPFGPGAKPSMVPKDVGGAKLTGELKLRFHLKRAHLLEGLDEACRQELIAHPAAYIRVLNRHTSYEPAAW